MRLGVLDIGSVTGHLLGVDIEVLLPGVSTGRAHEIGVRG
jgi:hypothetical protein